MIDVEKLSLKSAHQALKAGTFSAVELAQAYLDVIKKKDGEIHAYLEVYNDVIEQAKKADAMIAAGTMTELTGIPIALKDNILFKGKKASSASKMLENYTATYDATVVTKLKDAGAVFLGRTNMDEFAMGASTENSAFGPTRNPHDVARVPGGSSGGSAASVAMNGALVALGSDTGGSIRQPAGFCGVVGLKPSYGSVSRYGLMAMASSLDQIGPLTKTVEDAEIVFKAIRGKDRFDATSTDMPKPHPEKKIIGVPYAFIEKGLAPDVLANFETSLKALESAGYTLKDVSLPSIGYALAVYYIIVPAEVSSNLARFDGVKYGMHVAGKDLLEDYLLTRREGFGTEVRRRIILGTYVLSSGYYDAFYDKANEVRKAITEEFETVLKDVDAIAMPTSPGPAFKLGEKTSDPLAMYLEDIFTVPVNIAGLPGISIPSGTIEREGKALPFGIQFVGPYGGEDILFSIGKTFESVRAH